MPTPKILLTLLTVVLLSGCKVLTKSQLKNIDAFAKTTSEFSEYPGDLIRARSNLMFEERLVAATAMPDGEEIKRTISTAQRQHAGEMMLADSIDIPFRLLKQYAVLLQVLSSKKFAENLAAEKDDFNKGFNALLDISNGRVINGIPTGLGSAITEALFLAGDRLTKNQQAQALRKFIPQGQVIIKAVTGDLQAILDVNIKALLANDSTRWFNTYTNSILAREDQVNYSSLAQYAKGVNAFANLDALRKQCLASSAKMAAAHTKLEKSIVSRIHYKELFEETKAFGESVAQLYKLYRNIGAPKE